MAVRDAFDARSRVIAATSQKNKKATAVKQWPFFLAEERAGKQSPYPKDASALRMTVAPVELVP
jgi:hypothetical protein